MKFDENAVTFGIDEGERFHRDDSIHYQMKRWVHWGGIPDDVMLETGQKAKGIASLVSLALGNAGESSGRGDFAMAAAWWRGAYFFLPHSDSRKREALEKSRECFTTAYAGAITASGLTPDSAEIEWEDNRISIPLYRSSVWDESRETILMHGGFDSTLEELVPVAAAFSRAGYQVFAFEGPGQGSVLERDIAMKPEWERVVSPLLDAFGISRATLIGISLGGYLAPRSASRDPRIARIVIWGAMSDFGTASLSKLSAPQRRLVRALLAVGSRGKIAGCMFNAIVDALVSAKARRDPLLEWGVDHGMRVLGANSPSKFLTEAARYNLRDSWKTIRQDVFILMGRDDSLVPFSQLGEVTENLREAASVTVKVYGKSEHASDHCQVGNTALAIRDIQAWLELTVLALKKV